MRSQADKTHRHAPTPSVKGGDARKPIHQSSPSDFFVQSAPRPVELMGNNRRATFWMHAKNKENRAEIFTNNSGRDIRMEVRTWVIIRYKMCEEKKKSGGLWRGVFFFLRFFFLIHRGRNKPPKWMERKEDLFSRQHRAARGSNEAVSTFIFYFLFYEMCGETNASRIQNQPSSIIPEEENKISKKKRGTHRRGKKKKKKNGEITTGRKYTENV